jgi:DNA primase
VARIRDDDVVKVREAMPIDKVVGDYLQLRPAGGGSLKGLCPFHDERSPSFNVSTTRGLFHCFGCDKGGDAITFIREIEHLDFSGAVELLARKAGITLTYEGGGSSVRGQRGQRERLATANAEAARWMQERLVADEEARTGRDFLRDRGFDRAAAEQFGVGYAPRGWEAMTTHLLAQGFTREELTAGGLATTTSRGTIVDRFRGRLVWPIRDLAGDVVGFGARRLFDDDTGAKYLNTPETPLFKKSSLLYGLDVARREIGKRRQAIVVEGYTDVMACHLAGLTTAVATCGTAFGEAHVGLLRRLLLDAETLKGEVVFTFDGDAAGQKAALRAASLDDRFTLQTYVAVARDGLDPCDLRLQHGDQAVLDLLAAKVPLYEFVLRTAMTSYDLDTDEGRLAALGECVPVLSSIRDAGLRELYVQRVAGWLGFSDVGPVRARMPRAGAAGRAPAAPPPAQAGVQAVAAGVEREALKVALQQPAAAAAAGHDALEVEWWSDPRHAAVHLAIVMAGGTGGAESEWVQRVMDAAEDDPTRSLINGLAVQPLLTAVDAAQTGPYAAAQVRRVEQLHVERRLVAVKSRLHRGYDQATFEELMALEQRRQQLGPQR